AGFVRLATYDSIVPAGAVAGLKTIEPCIPESETTVPAGHGDAGSGGIVTTVVGTGTVSADAGRSGVRGGGEAVVGVTRARSSATRSARARRVGTGPVASAPR